MNSTHQGQAAQAREITALKARLKELRRELTKRKDKDAMRECPNCKAAFNSRTQITKSEQRERRSSVSKILRGMYPQDYEP